MHVTAAIGKHGVLPVIVIDDAGRALPLADALAAGGLPCAEITLRTEAGISVIERIAAHRPDILLGAGTVLTPEQAARSIDAGAAFVVTPGFNAAVVDYCMEKSIPVYPGVCTPTEVDMAMQRGLSVLKFFPAEPIGGVAVLNAIAAPYRDVRFIPTGGITLTNLQSYLMLRPVVACGGSWIAPAQAIAAGDFDSIRETAARTVARVRDIREENT